MEVIIGFKKDVKNLSAKVKTNNKESNDAFAELHTKIDVMVKIDAEKSDNKKEDVNEKAQKIQKNKFEDTCAEKKNIFPDEEKSSLCR